MSVNTSEEYLDELLQSIEPIIYMNEPVPESDMSQEDETESKTYDATANLLDNLMEIPQTDTPGEENIFSAVEETEIPEEKIVLPEAEIGLEDLMSEEPVKEDEVSMDDLLAALKSEESTEVEELSMSETDIDAMLSAAAGVAEENTYDPSVHDDDVKALLQQFTDDEDLSDISDILERNDNSEAVDESVLEIPEVEVFQAEEEKEGEQEPSGKESKGLFGFLKKKKKDKKKRAKEENVPEEAGDETVPEPVIEIETGEEIFGLGNNEESEAAPDLAEMSLDDIFAEGDMTDIEQLLSAGSFDESGVETEELGAELFAAETPDEISSKKKEKGGKKESLFSKILTMLTEEDEEEVPKKGGVPEADSTGVTDENLSILDELSKEEKKKTRKEKKEEKKKAKEAKKKGNSALGADGEGGEEDSEGDDKNNKKEKKKKVKKEKPRKVVDIDAKPEKKLSRKKVSVIFVLCLSILAMILILQNVVLNLSNLKEARWAFDNADYETCYANLYGEDLSEEDELIFQKSYVILCVQRKLDSYENFKQMDMGVEALNALFEGVRVYRDMEEKAESLGILNRITPIYGIIYDTLTSYGLSDADIEEILAYESRVSYTKRLESIVYGTPFVIEQMPLDTENVVEEEPQPLEDVLPQEEDFLPDDTNLVNQINQVEEDSIVSEPVVSEQGNTVVVGSAPVDINAPTQDAGNLGGVNVGSGNTNISAEVSGGNVFVN